MLRLNKSTLYALYATMEMARDGGVEPVTVAEVARRYGISSTVLAKAFQQLVRAELAVGSRGSGGGYRLARAPKAITVLEVLEAFEPTRASGGWSPRESGERRDGGAAELDGRLRRLLDEVDELVRCTFASVSVETLIGRASSLSPG